MSLINCSECGRTISDKAVRCPGCGAPVLIENSILKKQPQPLENQSKRKDAILSIIGLIFSCIYCFPLFPLAGLIISIISFKKEKEKSHTLSIVSIGMSIFYFLFIILLIFFGETQPSEDSEYANNQTQKIESTVPSETATPEPTKTPQEKFAVSFSETTDHVSIQTAENLYEFLNQSLGFEEIKFKEKNSAGEILFEIRADNYLLMVSVDNEGIYSIRCGGYELYNGEEILMTKNGLDDRNIGDNESKYYSIAKEIVKSSLKSPSTAKFPSLWSGDIRMSRNAELVVVQSYADAQNSFGATIRNDWTVEFKVKDLETFSYETVYINIDGNSVGEFIEIN